MKLTIIAGCVLGIIIATIVNWTWISKALVPVKAPADVAYSFSSLINIRAPKTYAFVRACGERCVVNVYDPAFCQMNAPLHTVTCQFPDEGRDGVFPDGMTDRMPYLLQHHE